MVGGREFDETASLQCNHWLRIDHVSDRGSRHRPRDQTATASLYIPSRSHTRPTLDSASTFIRGCGKAPSRGFAGSHRPVCEAMVSSFDGRPIIRGSQEFYRWSSDNLHCRLVSSCSKWMLSLPIATCDWSQSDLFGLQQNLLRVKLGSLVSRR